MAEIAERRATVKQVFSYTLFRPMSIDRLNIRFIRYFFGRVEFSVRRHEAEDEACPADLVTPRGAKTGFHVEHILSAMKRAWPRSR